MIIFLLVEAAVVALPFTALHFIEKHEDMEAWKQEPDWWVNIDYTPFRNGRPI